MLTRRELLLGAAATGVVAATGLPVLAESAPPAGDFRTVGLAAAFGYRQLRHIGNEDYLVVAPHRVSVQWYLGETFSKGHDESQIRFPLDSPTAYTSASFILHHTLTDLRRQLENRAIMAVNPDEWDWFQKGLRDSIRAMERIRSELMR
jgi:hypothetical protein